MLFKNPSYLKFDKYHGNGNDILILDGLDDPSNEILGEPKLREVASKAGDRATGIGFDQAQRLHRCTILVYWC